MKNASFQTLHGATCNVSGPDAAVDAFLANLSLHGLVVNVARNVSPLPVPVMNFGDVAGVDHTTPQPFPNRVRAAAPAPLPLPALTFGGKV